MKLILQDVRCFRGEQTASLRPLTFLVGENSAGKSTFLAMVRAAHAVRAGVTPDFNEPPFPLGAFDQLAHYHGGKGKRAKRFKIGSEFPIQQSRGAGSQKSPRLARVVGVFDAEATQPTLCEWNLECGSYRVSVARGDGRKVNLEIDAPSGKSGPIVVDVSPGAFGRDMNWLRSLMFLLQPTFRIPDAVSRPDALAAIDENDARSLLGLLQTVVFAAPERPVAIAPIRTQPRRTYDPVRDDPTPEGDHVPMVLSNLSTSDAARWGALRSALQEFGRDSGLLRDIKVERKGKKKSDPFQLFVSVGRYPFNLVDVGYGVSQVLPILVDAFRAPAGTTFLLQQPEVHLHPRAQAALGSFLARLAATQDKRFIIETHSDYLIDRVRMEIRKLEYSRLRDGAVELLFFARVAEHVEIQAIEIDDAGDIMNSPDGYRQFFANENRRLLGIENVSNR